MTLKTTRGARAIALLLVASTLASCGLPRTGPNKNEIFAGSVERSGDAYIVEVSDAVARATSTLPGLGFGEGFRNAGLLGSDTISPGDTRGLTIWENVDDGLLVPTGANAQQLEEVQVDDSGFIFIPYAGRIMAAGNTPNSLRELITRNLDEQTPDPQVVVRRAADGSPVTDGAQVQIGGNETYVSRCRNHWRAETGHS